MRILELMLPRLESLARLAGDRDTVRHPAHLAGLRDDYRYLAAVCRNTLPDLEMELAELPAPLPHDAPVEDRVAYQMTLIRRTNRLHRAVEAAVSRRHSARRKAVRALPAQRRQG